MKIEGKILLFFSSYIPCWIIFSFNQNKIVSYLGIGSIFLSLFTLYIFKQTYESITLEGKTAINVKNISNGSSEVISYLLSIVIPVTSSNTIQKLTEGIIDTDFIVFLVLGILLFLVYLSSNLVVINPMLIILKYSLYLIDYTKSKNEENVVIKGILITKNNFDPETMNADLIVEKVGTNVYMYFEG